MLDFFSSMQPPIWHTFTSKLMMIRSSGKYCALRSYLSTRRFDSIYSIDLRIRVIQQFTSFDNNYEKGIVSDFSFEMMDFAMLYESSVLRYPLKTRPVRLLQWSALRDPTRDPVSFKKPGLFYAVFGWPLELSCRRGPVRNVLRAPVPTH